MTPDSKKDYFADRASTFDQGTHRVRNVDMIADAIRKQVALTPEMTVMDFGAGTGLLLERIAPQVAHMLAVDTSASMLAELQKIPEKYARQIVAKIDLLAENTLSIPSRQLAGHPTLRRIKSGEYRIIYTVENEVLEIHILRIGKRNDDEDYKSLENLEK